jgi:hypothetical protein
MRNAELKEELAQAPWLVNIGQEEPEAEYFGSYEEILQAAQSDAEGFFSWQETGPYEALCMEDHLAAAQLETDDMPAQVSAVAQRAHDATWARLPVRALCEQVKDDVQTLMLLLEGEAPVGAFAAARARWYIRGRVPWGYIGQFPEGRWMIL